MKILEAIEFHRITKSFIMGMNIIHVVKVTQVFEFIFVCIATPVHCNFRTKCFKNNDLKDINGI